MGKIIQHPSFSLCLLVLVLVFSPVSAITTQYIEHNSEELFKQGDANQVIISTEGHISLAYQSRDILATKEPLWVVNDLVEAPDGTLFIALSGDPGGIFQIQPGQEPRKIYGQNAQEQKHVFCLALDGDGALLAGTGGQSGLLLKFQSDGSSEILFEDSEIKYIWSIIVGPSGRVYLGSGPSAKVFTLKDTQPHTEAELLFKGKEKNILALALDSQGILYAGGDEFGLVYRIDPGTGKAQIAYDTAHSEISDLLVDPSDNLYIATADARAARPGAVLILSDKDPSRAEKTTPDDDEDDDSSPGSDDDEIASDEFQEQPYTEKTIPAAKLVPPAVSSSDDKTTAASHAAAPASTSGGKAKANDIFQITPQGYVRSLLQTKVVFLSMAQRDGKILLGTGNEGKLIQLDPLTEEAVVLHTAQPALQIAAVLAGKDNTLYLGLANPASVIALDQTLHNSGIYTSPAADGQQISQWGRLQIEADIPESTALTISTRTGNASDPEKAPWDEWTQPVPAQKTNPVLSPPGRFLQYRLCLQSTDGKISPLLKSVQLAYLTPNLPPIVKNLSVTREPSKKTGKENHSAPELSRNMQIKWLAEEPNKDDLIYELFVRTVDQDQGIWIRIAKEITKPLHVWDTQTVSDGRYEVKVIASDKLSNPAGAHLTASRISAPVIIDNTPPEMIRSDYSIQNDTILFQGQFQDRLSVIESVMFVLDSDEHWQLAMPEDGIYDSTDETISFQIQVDQPGAHLLAVRAQDVMGNQIYKNFNIKIPAIERSEKQKN